ncbi:hypothetical protein [Methylorubrum aminovorans]|uniref:PilZ domain-containing protein n=1 Tax=Methylorubrum aminovorans TaxID=269069 RepID=A0ABQ4UH74_9HYPH|nr:MULTISPECIES: hypothetical protein [Methylobacteriaceae]QIJ76785.1 hypothetical protein CLZ_20710 [Methylobacterium sp. CLZ]QIJ81688.1 hypothetical protein GU700_20715 [Methylobacterium sp. NI91]GJE66348.1 hypothetical protein LNAOJCKE_3567 [Methylorubrum aminovorans]GMA75375.1 hypothetical protein GCM10025880_17920 [Methylorubrum aminovorans]
MLEGYRDLFLQDAFKVGLISSSESRSDIGCLVWDETPDGVDVEVGADVIVPDSVRLSIACLKIDCRCAVVEREGCRLYLAFVR